MFWIVVLLMAAGGKVQQPSVPGARLFRQDYVLKIHLRMDSASFRKLRKQTRSAGHGYALDVFDPAPQSPYTWFKASVNIDGQDLGEVGVRKKGFFGSLSSKRPSLKINTDKFHKGLKVDGIKRLVLNNGKEGGAWLRQCMAYSLFSRASYPGSRCGFAHVWVNDENLGLYVLVEHVDKTMLARYFKDPSGALFEGLGSDFRPGWVDTFETKNKRSERSIHRLHELAKIMALPDRQLLDSLGELVDMDSFYSFWALESVIGHQDGYNASGNNFFLYLDPDSNRFFFLPWGMDKVMAYADRVVSCSPLTVLTGSVLSYRLYRIPKTRHEYKRKLLHVLNKAWNSKELLKQLRLTKRAVLKDMLPSQRRRFKYAYPNLEDFVRNRYRVLIRALKNKEPEPKPGLCKAPWWRTMNGTNHGRVHKKVYKQGRK